MNLTNSFKLSFFTVNLSILKSERDVANVSDRSSWTAWMFQTVKGSWPFLSVSGPDKRSQIVENANETSMKRPWNSQMNGYKSLGTLEPERINTLERMVEKFHVHASKAKN